MKAAAVALVAVMCCVMLMSCSDSGDATVTLNLKFPENVSVLRQAPDSLIDRFLRFFSSPAEAASIIDVRSVAVRISGPGMDAFEKKYTADTLTVVFAVEAGKDRTFLVKAYNGSGQVIYAGSTTVDLKAGEARLLIITLAGTLRMVEDINTTVDVGNPLYTDSSSPGEMTEYDGRFYFAAYTDTYGTELWVYDPAADTVELAADIFSGTSSSSPSELTVFNGLLYFTAADADANTELWSYDGVNDPVVHEVNASGSSSPANLTVVNNMLFFSASDGSSMQEPFVCVGSAEPALVYDIVSGYDSFPFGFCELDGRVFYFADSTGSGYNYTYLYEYNGVNVAPTSYLITYATTTSIDTSSSPVLFNDRLYFVYYDSMIDPYYCLYSFDGIAVEQILPTQFSMYNTSNQKNLAELNGRLYFPVYEGSYGNELWSYDGIAPMVQDENFVRESDIYAGVGNSTPDYVTAVDGMLYFETRIDDGSEPYFYSCNPATGDFLQIKQEYVSNIRGFNSVVAVEFGSDNKQVWIYDPSREVSDGVNPYQLEINSLFSESSAEIIAIDGNRLYLSANDVLHGTELWVYDYYK